MPVVAEGLEPSPKGESYTVWVADSPQKMLRLSSTDVPKSGKIAAQFEVPTEVLAYLAEGTFDQIVVTATNEAQLNASFDQGEKEGKLPIYLAPPCSEVRSPVRSPAPASKKRSSRRVARVLRDRCGMRGVRAARVGCPHPSASARDRAQALETTEDDR